ncbi:hypothetical protein ACOMHN_001477 [Nucella lapillus]
MTNCPHFSISLCPQRAIDDLGETEAVQILMTLSTTLPIQTLPYLSLRTSPTTWDRLDNTEVPGWCACGLCLTSDLPEERVCCGVEECLTKGVVFVDLCTKAHVLQLARIQSVACKHVENVHLEPFSPQLCRSLAMRVFVLWQWGCCSGGQDAAQMPPLPSCVRARISRAFPSPEEPLDHFGTRRDSESGV